MRERGEGMGSGCVGEGERGSVDGGVVDELHRQADFRECQRRFRSVCEGELEIEEVGKGKGGK